MKRPARILLSAATVGLLLMSVAACCLWARSSFRVKSSTYIHEPILDALYVHTESSRYRLNSEDGAIVIARFPAAPADRGRPTIAVYFDVNHGWRIFGVEKSEEDGHMSGMWAGDPGSYSFLGVGIRPTRNWAGASPVVRLPYWLVLVMLASPVLARRLLKGRRDRAAVGLCPACGYDLRATPDRCPECGAVQKVLVRIPN